MEENERGEKTHLTIKLINLGYGTEIKDFGVSFTGYAGTKTDDERSNELVGLPEVGKSAEFSWEGPRKWMKASLFLHGQEDIMYAFTFQELSPTVKQINIFFSKESVDPFALPHVDYQFLEFKDQSSKWEASGN